MVWHLVLNDGFSALNEEEDNDYYNGLLSITKEQSWKRIFDYKKLNQNEFWLGEEKLQAVTGKIELAKLKLVKELKAR